MDIDADLLAELRNMTGLQDISEIANLALREMVDRLAQRAMKLPHSD